jgi:hypothetical protein
MPGFSWEKLADGALVVDVGGNTGALCLPIAQKFAHINFLVQERDAVVKSGEEVGR